MRVLNHNWSATKQRPHLQSAAEISRHSVFLSGDRLQQCETFLGRVELVTLKLTDRHEASRGLSVTAGLPVHSKLCGNVGIFVECQ